MPTVAQCKKCMGAGEVEFTKEFGGPVCQHCMGKGYMTRKIICIRIASLLDGSSVYMGGPSHGNLKKANAILDLMNDEGVTILPE